MLPTALAGHFEQCPDCQAGLATLSDTDDTLIARLRGPAVADPFLEEPECREALVRAAEVAAGTVPIFGGGKGDRHHLPERPGGCFAQMVPVPFSSPETSEPSLPKQLGEYQLIERLGSGSMGTVYKAQHNRLDRAVALKVLPRSRSDDPRAVVRFEREMKAIGRLDHPHIVRAYDAREIDNRLVLVMEYVEGLDLRKITRRLGRLAVADACEIARQAALGLQAAHENGLVHRDIKPSNLMLTPEGRVKLLDLGLARIHGGLSQFSRPSDVASPTDSPAAKMGLSPSAAQVGNAGFSRMGAGEPPEGGTMNVADEDLTGTGQAMGTADYMAPEQASDSRAVDIRADIYSLGATLYRLLSGRAPFGGPEHQGTLEKMIAHRQEPIPPIRQLCPEIPDGLAGVLDRMLAKSPEDRYSTPAEVAAALMPWCGGADLPALLQRAIATEERPADAAAKPLLSPNAGDSVAEKPQPLAASQRWRSILTLVGLFLLGGVLGFALGIAIRITKDGHVYLVNVPEDSESTVHKDGSVDVKLAGAGESGKATTASPAAELKALEGSWDVVRIEKGEAASLMLPAPPKRRPDPLTTQWTSRALTDYVLRASR